MRYLLDTHMLVWWLNGSKKLSLTARELITDEQNDIFVSAASAWEIVTKYQRGQLDTALSLLPDFSKSIEDNGFINQHITSTHMVRSALLPGAQRDPFDRILSAQATIENMALITVDEKIALLGVVTSW